MNKKLSALRVFTELIRFFLAALLSFGAMLIAALAFLGAEKAMPAAAISLCAMACYVGGKLTKKRRPRVKKAASVLLVCASVGGAAALLRARYSSEYVFLAIMLIPTIALLYLGGRETFPRSVSIAAVVVLLADIIIFTLAESGDIVVVSVCAVTAFLLCLLEASLSGLADGARSNAPPAGMLGKNLLLLGAFLAVSVGIALTGILQKLISALFRGAVAGVSAIGTFISSLFPDVTMTASEVEVTAAVSELPEEVEPGKWRYLVYAFFLVLTVACVAALVAVIIRVIKSRGKREKRRRRDLAHNGLDDEVEDIFDLSELLHRGREGLGSALGKFRRRERFSDMKTDESRVRFAFRELKRARVRDGEAVSVNARTPIELADGVGEATAQLAEDYSAMRYGGIVPDGAAGENARAAISEIRGA
jgi:hypothetical protein